MNCNNNLIPTLIGVLGTLAGVVLGAFLNKLLTMGKLKVYITKFDLFFLEQDGYGSIIKTPKITPNARFVDIDLEVEIYNSASDQRILREICLIRHYKDEDKKYLLKDNSTKKIVVNSIITSSPLEVYTLSPKTIKKFHLSLMIEENLDEIESSKFYFHFLNHKGKKTNIELKSKNN